MSTSLPVWRLTDKVGGQDNELELLTYCFVKLGGAKMPGFKFQALVMTLD